MKILILEGIPTSGKSTLAESIKGQLAGLAVRVVTERQTHEPIMMQTKQLHLLFFERLIQQAVAGQSDLVIFDRLYLTQAVRANARLTEYSAIEHMLSAHNALSVYLRVDEDAIAVRIAKAVAHRDASTADFQWGEHFKTKGNTDDEIAAYYIAQQRKQIALLGTSTLPHMICDSTHHGYAEITAQTVEKLNLGG
jgi:thymidylate kinase